MQDIQDICKRLRRRNLSSFARDSGVSRSTLNRVLGGWYNPTLQTLRKIEAQLAKEDKKESGL